MDKLNTETGEHSGGSHCSTLRLFNAIKDALIEMDKCPEDSVQDIWNECLESWETGLRMDHNYNLANVSDHRCLPVADSVPGAKRPSTECDAGSHSVDRIVRDSFDSGITVDVSRTNYYFEKLKSLGFNPVPVSRVGNHNKG
jgi:hypothetical protein